MAIFLINAQFLLLRGYVKNGKLHNTTAFPLNLSFRWQRFLISSFVIVLLQFPGGREIVWGQIVGWKNERRQGKMFNGIFNAVWN